MHFVISDSEGNTLDSFHDAEAAERALLAIVAEHPAEAQEVLLLAYEDGGRPAGPARIAEDILAKAWHRRATTDTVRDSQIVVLISPAPARRQTVTLSRFAEFTPV